MSAEKIKQTAARTAVVMVLLNLGCKCLGFLREMAVAAFYGAGYIVDSFVMAQSIPNILLGGILVAVATAYMPIYAEKIRTGGEEEGNVYTSQVIFLLVGLSCVTALLGIIFSKQLVHLMARGFQGDAMELTAVYLKITFAYTIFSSTVGIYTSYLQYKNRFLLQILGDYLQNICNILFIVISAYINNKLLAWGLFLGYALRCGFLCFLARKRGFRYQMRLSGLNKTIIDILAVSIPVFLGTTMQEINTFVDRTLAAGLSSGSISALNYANQINNIVISLSVTILTTIIYPKLLHIDYKAQIAEFSAIVQKGMNMVLMISVPVTLGSIIYGKEIVKIIYERGVFDEAATQVTSAAYKYYALGIIFLALNAYLTKVYYSIQNTKIPMICAGIGMAINIVLNIVLVVPMRQNGLALATSLATMINVILQLIIFKRKYNHIKLIDSTKKVIEITAAGLVSLTLSYVFKILFISIIGLPDVFGAVFAMSIAVILYILLLILFKIEEFNYLMNSLLKR